MSLQVPIEENHQRQRRTFRVGGEQGKKENNASGKTFF